MSETDAREHDGGREHHACKHAPLAPGSHDGFRERLGGNVRHARRELGRGEPHVRAGGRIRAAAALPGVLAGRGALLRESALEPRTDVVERAVRIARVEVALEVFEHRVRARVPIVTPRRERLAKDRAELRRQLRRDARGERRHIATDQAAEDREVIGVAPDPRSRHELAEENAHREDVGAAVDGAAVDVIRRHVLDRALHHADLRGGGGLAVGALRNPEIDELHVAVVGEKHVWRAHVAVDDAEREAVFVHQTMRVVERLEHRREDPEAERDRQRAHPELLADLRERSAFEQLELHEVATVVTADLVRLDDVAVRQPRREPRFVEEHRAILRVLRELVLQLLDDDQLLEPARPSRLGKMHHPHAAASELREQAIASEKRLRVHAWKTPVTRGRFTCSLFTPRRGHCPASQYPKLQAGVAEGHSPGAVHALQLVAPFALRSK